MRLSLCFFLFPLLTAFALCQSTSSESALVSDPQALKLAIQSMTAMTGGALVTDVTLNGAVSSFLGSDRGSGTGTWIAKGTGESRIDLSLDTSRRTEIFNNSSGFPAGKWIGDDGKSHVIPQHNCWSSPVWFFPVLTSLSQSTLTTSFFFSYVGREQHNGIDSQHIRVSQLFSKDTLTGATFQSLTATDIFLDASSLLPLAISFSLHDDNDVNTQIPVEIRFANYQLVSGIQVPFHIQKLLNGSLLLDFTVTGAAINSGVSDTTFNL